MSDPSQHDPPLSAAQEAAVRRALARAGGPEPMPAEIADRLDVVIADLASARAAGEDDGDAGDRTGDGPAGAGPPGMPAGTVPTGETTGSAPSNPSPSGPAAGSLPAGPPPPGPPGVADASAVVLPMDPAARRRRVRARIVLGAAAATVAVAVGAGLLSDRDGEVGADALSQDSPARTADSASEAPRQENGARPREEDAAQPTQSVPAPGAHDSDYGIRRVVTDEPLRVVHRGRLREDLMDLQRAALPHPAAADYDDGATLTAPADFSCASADYGDGYLIGVTYEDEPAIVAFRKPAGTTQEAEVLACGTADVLHSTTLPAR